MAMREWTNQVALHRIGAPLSISLFPCRRISMIPILEDSKRRSYLTGVVMYVDRGERTGATVGCRACS